ncbi:hypothetical protein ACH4E5_02245 [Streptomyces afghaniensis]|uniref:hypothetical protein n=1 Tax=Streptomyces afghaniensis TaxID=66865 RepID=UPI0037BCA5AA
MRAAADRLLAGTPLHSSGKLTILDLAEEAQVKRWPLTHKYPTTLMAKYQAEFKAARHKSEPVKKAEAEINKPREDLTRLRKEKRQLADLLGTYTVMIEKLARERAEGLAERNEAAAARNAALGVTALSPPPQRTAPGGESAPPASAWTALTDMGSWTRVGDRMSGDHAATPRGEFERGKTRDGCSLR